LNCRAISASVSPRLRRPKKQPICPANRAENEEFEQEGVVPDDGAEDAEQQQVEQDFQGMAGVRWKGLQPVWAARRVRGGGGCRAADPRAGRLILP